MGIPGTPHQAAQIEAVPEIGTALDSLLPKGKEVAAQLADAENVAKRFLRGVCAQTTPNKEERTERTNTTTMVVATNEMVAVVETLTALFEYGMVGESVAERFQESAARDLRILPTPSAQR